MNAKEKLELIKRNTSEVIGLDRLEGVLKGKRPVAYCGYEPSGDIHIGHLVTIMKLRDLERAGFKVKVLLADWHAWLNRKGDWKFIDKQVSLWKSSFKKLGLKNPEIIVGTDFERDKDYINDVFTLASGSTLNRGLRAMQEVARDIEHAKVTQIIYPFMQIADMKYLEVDIAVAGMEQRKIHMMGLESLKDIDYKVPVFVHTPLITSLTGKGKMSSSDKGSLISVKDSGNDVKKKISKAYCPEGIVKGNPILEIAKSLVFPFFEKIEIKRDKKFGGDTRYDSYEDLEGDFSGKKLHPADLKNAVSLSLSEIFKKL